MSGGIVMGKRIVGRPRIVTVGAETNRGGVHCCCCTCCTCIHLQFLRTTEGKLKLAEVVLAAICQSMIFNYGMAYSQTIGPAYDSFLTTVSSCLLTATILLVCYLLSDKSPGLVRSSLFETLFNAVAALLYFSSSSYLSFAVNTTLRLQYIVTPFFQVYPAMTAAYVLGAVCVGLVGYYGNRYYYDVGAQAAEWLTLWLKSEQLDVWKPVTFFLLVATACLMNSLCLLLSSTLSFNTAALLPKTIYGIIYHFLAFALYLSASITLMVYISKKDIKKYRDGYYYEPFMAAGIIGAINSGFYLLSTILSYRSYRGTI